MKVVIFGLSISSAWGNGHATLWRGLSRALTNHGHKVVFFERDVPYYSENRDFLGLSGLKLLLYSEWNKVAQTAHSHVSEADAAIVTSFCPDGLAASELVLASASGAKVFYDMDTPVTLKALAEGRPLSYVGSAGLGGFDLVLSFTGGRALEALKSQLGARAVAPLYGSVDPNIHKPSETVDRFASDLSFLGTYSADRRDSLCRFLVEPSRLLPGKLFRIAGAQYPQDFPWARNIFYVPHVPPPEHASFYSSSGFTLNLTRQTMSDMGFCPSGRLFEAAACGSPILTDEWEGLEQFLRPGIEVIVVRSTQDVVEALSMDSGRKQEIARAARKRVLSSHTAEQRSYQLEILLQKAIESCRRG
jgi:spore maturation protein CgeB